MMGLFPPDRAMKQLKYVERCQAQREINLIDMDGLGRVGPWDLRFFLGFVQVFNL